MLHLVGNDERFKAIERGRDREDMFEEYVVELEKKVGFVLINNIDGSKTLNRYL